MLQNEYDAYALQAPRRDNREVAMWSEEIG